MIGSPADAPARQAETLTTDGRVAPLDGMRAFAVLAVILFHAYTPWAVGGYFGVDVFFVLSGYLITGILLAEWQKRDTISLRHFWARRARRLLPALFLMLLVVLVVADVWPSVLGSPGLLWDTVTTLFYSSNWRFLAEHAGYFTASATPSPLLHTWTLAIEEQFYLVWPLVVLGVLALFSRRRRAHRRERGAGGDSMATPHRSSRRARLVLLAAASLGAVASAAWMWVVTPSGTLDVNRAYYGSDTRAQAILIGAALALACTLWGPVTRSTAKVVLWCAGVVGAAVVMLMWRSVAETSALAFHGGFAIVALGAAAVVLCVSQLPRHPLALGIGIAPLRYVGRISYGMYLWYWPVLLVLTPGRAHLDGVSLLAVRILVIVVVAGLSFRFVETPIQHGALRQWRPWVLVPVAASLVAALAVYVPQSPLTSAALPAAADAARLTVSRIPGTTGRPPVRILVVGDSMAGSFGVGLSMIAPDYGAQVVNRGTPACSLGAGSQVKVLWYTIPPKAPCEAGDSDHLLATYRGFVRQFDPDVVLYLARTDTFDTELDGSWQYLGEPPFDHWVKSRYEQAISVLSSRGAHVVLLTSPYYMSGEQSDGQPLPENDPIRVRTENRLLQEAAARDPRVASVFDFGADLSPTGQFADKVDGVPVRCGDGIHISLSGGLWMGKRLLPEVVSLGRSHAATAVLAHRAPLPPQGPPPWFATIPCDA